MTGMQSVPCAVDGPLDLSGRGKRVSLAAATKAAILVWHRSAICKVADWRISGSAQAGQREESGWPERIRRFRMAC